MAHFHAADGARRGKCCVANAATRVPRAPRMCAPSVHGGLCHVTHLPPRYGAMWWLLGLVGPGGPQSESSLASSFLRRDAADCTQAFGVTAAGILASSTAAELQFSIGTGAVQRRRVAGWWWGLQGTARHSRAPRRVDLIPIPRRPPRSARLRADEVRGKRTRSMGGQREPSLVQANLTVLVRVAQQELWESTAAAPLPPA